MSPQQGLIGALTSPVHAYHRSVKDIGDYLRAVEASISSGQSEKAGNDLAIVMIKIDHAASSVASLNASGVLDSRSYCSTTFSDVLGSEAQRLARAYEKRFGSRDFIDRMLKKLEEKKG